MMQQHHTANRDSSTDLTSTLRAWQEDVAREGAQALPESVVALVRMQAQRYRDAPLVHLFEDGESISYSELDVMSDHLAQGWLQLGLREGERVAVMLTNCIQYHVTWIALAKAGAVIVPVNPQYTARELKYVLNDSEASAWMFHGSAAALVAEVQSEVPSLRPNLLIAVDGPLRGESSPWHALLRSGEQTGLGAPAAIPGLRTVLNFQYTSGTTGFPKACVLDHGYWLNLARSAMSLHVQTHQRFFTAQPFYYMDPFWQFLQSLWSGGVLVAARKLSASKFLGWLAQHRIDWAQVPELACKTMDQVEPGSLVLRQAFTFGWSASGRQAFVERYRVVANESFGMTEVGLGLAMPVPWPATDHPTSVGVAALRRRTRLVVDEDGVMRDARPGETGELWLGGEHLFQGYWNKPEANVQVWQDSWFRTGDAFVCDEQGFFQIVGRFKDMIRRSSENIAAREVEAVVRQLTWVLDCAAVAVPDATRGEEVKVWVQLHPDAAPTQALDVAALVAHCQANLAPFKQPRYYARIEEFPRTSSNKIAKHQLPATGVRGCYDRQTQTWNDA